MKTNTNTKDVEMRDMSEVLIPDMQLNNILLGKRVKEARDTVHMTQEELSHIIECSTTHLSNIEKGKIGISLKLLFKISVATDRKLDFFVMDNPNADPQLKINLEIAPKLQKCDQFMLDMVDEYIQKLLAYQERIKGSVEEPIE